MQTKLVHQPLYRAARHPVSFALELSPDLAHAAHLPVLFPHLPDLRAQRPVLPPTVRPQVHVRFPRHVAVIRRRSSLQCLADRLDPVDVTIFAHGTPSGLEAAVELRLGEIRAGLAQDLVGLPKLTVLAQQPLQLRMLVRTQS